MKKRFEVLDIFRGMFSLFVVLYHMSAFSKTPIINNNFIHNSDLFVDFFFVLSGFVIAYSYSSIINFAQFKIFFKKRFLRLYPLHLIILLFFVLIEFSKQFFSAYVHINQLNNSSNNLTTFFTSLFLVNSVKIAGIKEVSWNIASWSISAEMISYLCFGLLMVFISYLKLQKLVNLFFIIVIAFAIAALIRLTKTTELTFTFDYGFLRGLIGFFTGVLCLKLYSKVETFFYKINKTWFSLIETLVFILIVLMIWNGTAFKPFGFVYELLFFVAVMVFSFEQGIISRQLKKYKLLHNLGKYSYSIYITHTLLISLFNIIFIRLLKFPASAYSYLFILNLMLIYFVSAFSYQQIEMRFSAGKKSIKAKVW